MKGKEDKMVKNKVKEILREKWKKEKSYYVKKAKGKE